MTRASLVLMLATTIAPLTGHAEQRTVDLQLDANVSALHFQPSELKLVELTLRNNGPDIAEMPTAASSWYEIYFPGQQLDIFEVEQTAPCEFQYFHLDVRPGNPVPYSAHVWFPSLLPGESATCSVGIRATSTATGSHTLSFSAFDGILSPSSEVQDPVPSNDSRVIDLTFPTALPPAVSVAATRPPTLLLLSLSLLAGGAPSLRRRLTRVAPV